MTADDLRERYGSPSFSFTVAGLSNGHFEGRPISVDPEEPTIGFLYGRVGDNLHQVGAAVFENGAWRRLSKSKGLEPTHWVVMTNG